jgi:hypothetical protein
MLPKNTLQIFLFTAFIIETLCITYLQTFTGLAAFTSVLYFISSISIAVAVLFFSPAKNPGMQLNNGLEKYLRFFLILISGILLCYFSKIVFSENPFDYHNADMLPVIKKMNERFIDGHWKKVYDTIPEIWNGSNPIYLPAMWLPFSPAVILHIDLRWITVAALFLITAISLLVISFKKRSSFVIIAIVAVILWWLLSENDTHGFLSFSEEGFVVLYYFLLVFALASENIFLIGVLSCLCLLSRYALIGWVPAFFLFLLVNKKRKEAVTFTMIGIVSFLFLFIIPFGWKAFSNLLQLPAQYVDFSKRVWNDSPEVFSDGIGLAKFFVPGKLQWLHTILISSSFAVPLVFMIVCNFYKKKKKLSNIPLATLKIAIMIFYNFIDVPYLYLFYTSTFVSLAIVIILNNNREEKLKTAV